VPPAQGLEQESGGWTGGEGGCPGAGGGGVQGGGWTGGEGGGGFGTGEGGDKGGRMGGDEGGNTGGARGGGGVGEGGLKGGGGIEQHPVQSQLSSVNSKHDKYSLSEAQVPPAHGLEQASADTDSIIVTRNISIILRPQTAKDSARRPS